MIIFSKFVFKNTRPCDTNGRIKGKVKVKVNIVRVIKSRRMRWAGHVARMGEGRGVYRVLVGNPRGRDRWGDQGVDGRIILRWTFRRWE